MEWQGPIWNDCGCCNYTRRTLDRDDLPRWCVWCATNNLAALKTFAHNLQIAAGLCRAFDLGVESCFTYCEHWYGPDGWKPGCGKAAP